ncbi:MAPEG family protein [Paracoccus sp. p4-l81]|uniref:MAPEG family protein n=1 Tax=unclassified Paracoccus (in: a-proteobacteria) TaxID=2688777 RepID=UPI0035B9EE85
MTPELSALTLAALLQAVQFALYAVVANRGPLAAYHAGPRDGAPPADLPVLAGRLKRALNNHFEGLILFGIAAVVIAVSGQSTAFTAACAWAYLGARLLYVPAYAFGWTPGRSIIWGIGFMATLAMLIAALL